jgi:hypothetical protein
MSNKSKTELSSGHVIQSYSVVCVEECLCFMVLSVPAS